MWQLYRAAEREAGRLLQIIWFRLRVIGEGIGRGIERRAAQTVVRVHLQAVRSADAAAQTAPTEAAAAAAAVTARASASSRIAKLRQAGSASRPAALAGLSELTFGQAEFAP